VPNHTPSSPTHDYNDDYITPTSSKRLLSPSQTSNAVNQQNKQQKYVSKNRFSLFSDQIENSDNADINPDDMELESELNEQIITVAKPSPPPIFIRTVNDFNTFCNTIKEVTKGEQFSCKSSINGIKLSTQSPDSHRFVIKFI